MPLYVYRCPCCARMVEVVKPMSEAGTKEGCSQCGRVMVKDLRANLPHAAADSYHRAIHSDALAVHSDQVSEHKRMYPDVPLDCHNRPVFTNYRQHSNYLEARGLVKQPALHQKRGRKIR